MVIVVTGTIAPKKQDYLIITEVEKRLLQYRNTLEQLIMCGNNLKIVFCENSNYGVDAFSDMISMAKEHGSQLELLSFEGDSSKVVEQGKGYGEGEIMKYAFANSRLLKADDYLIKLTGRLFVDNMNTIMRALKMDRIYFNVPNIHRTDMYDTRFYAMPIQIYETYFMNAYVKVNDSEDYFLEYVYTDIVLEQGLKSYNFPRYPRITGISGSNGLIYSYTKWKSIIRDMLSLLNLYGKIRRG